MTEINLHTFEFDEPWHFYRWHNEKGTQKVTMPQHTKEREDLKDEVKDSSGEGLPYLIKERPVFALLFLVVYPHGIRPSFLRWLTTAIKDASMVAKAQP